MLTPPPLCTLSAPSQFCVSDSLGQVSILQDDGSGLLKRASTYKAHSYEAWVTAFDCWEPNTLYSGAYALTPLPYVAVCRKHHILLTHSITLFMHVQCASPHQCSGVTDLLLSVCYYLFVFKHLHLCCCIFTVPNQYLDWQRIVVEDVWI